MSEAPLPGPHHNGGPGCGGASQVGILASLTILQRALLIRECPCLAVLATRRLLAMVHLKLHLLHAAPEGVGCRLPLHLGAREVGLAGLEHPGEAVESGLCVISRRRPCGKASRAEVIITIHRLDQLLGLGLGAPVLHLDRPLLLEAAARAVTLPLRVLHLSLQLRRHGGRVQDRGDWSRLWACGRWGERGGKVRAERWERSTSLHLFARASWSAVSFVPAELCFDSISRSSSSSSIKCEPKALSIWLLASFIASFAWLCN